LAFLANRAASHLVWKLLKLVPNVTGRGEKTLLDRAGEPTGGQSQGDHNKDNVENEHDPAHGLGHPPLEGENGDEDQHQHQEQHADVAAHA
jgi:hypothetical protein